MSRGGLDYYKLDHRGNDYVKKHIEMLLTWNPPQPLAKSVYGPLDFESWTAFAIAPFDVAFDQYQFETGISFDERPFADLWESAVEELLDKDTSLAYLLNEAVSSLDDPWAATLSEECGDSYKECQEAIFFLCAGIPGLRHAKYCYNDSDVFGHMSVLIKVEARNLERVLNRVQIPFEELVALVQCPIAIFACAYDTDGIVMLTSDRSLLDTLLTSNSGSK